MFPGLLNQTCTITRQVAIEGSAVKRTQPQVIYTSIPCLVIPMNHRTAIDMHFDIGRASDVFFNVGQDVKPEDVVTVGGNTYVVGAVQAYNVPVAGYTVAHGEQEIS